LELLEENIRETLEGRGIGKDFLIRIPIAQEIRASFDKWDCIKLKIFCLAKETMQCSESLPNGKKSLPAIHLTAD
jgi:hypothetical protein